MIPIKTPHEIELMAQAGKILAEVMKEIKAMVAPGIATEELDKAAKGLILKFGAQPAFKGYQGFPKTLCVSINEQIVHGVPSERIIKEGDVVGLDLGIVYPAGRGKHGYYADMAITLPVGSVEPEAARLIKATKKALKRAIARVKPGKTLGDISHAIQGHIEDQGFSIIRDLCGHGIGRQLHEEPEIPNYGQRHKGPELKPGMVLAIEPMACLGRPGIKKGPDRFSYQTADNSIAAHFEHTIAVTAQGPRVLTE